MKKLILLLSLTALATLTTPTVAMAQSATDSAAQNLLDRVATKVATLAESLKKGVAGEISSLGKDTIDIGNQKILVSEATTYYRIRAGNKSTIDFKNLAKGQDIAAIGTADAATGELTARQIIAKVQRLVVTGKVVAVDTKKNIYTVGDKDAEIDSSTEVKKATDSAVIKAKYSEIGVGDNLILFGYYNKPDEPLTTLKAIIVSQ